MAQHPNSIRAWSHNAMRGSVIRAQRSCAWLMSYVWTAPTSTPRAQALSSQIIDLFRELIEELRIRKDTP